MDDARTVWCGNLSDQITEELLYELFLQAAPLEKVRIPTDRDGKKSNFAFITFKHEDSVHYAHQLLNGTRIFDKPITVRPRNQNSQDRNSSRNEFQNTVHHGMVHGELPRLGLSGQHSYDPRLNNYNEHHRANYNDNRWEHNAYHDNSRDESNNRHRGNNRPYKKHLFFDRQNDSPRRRNDDRKNFNDRNNRRNHY